MVHFLFQYYPFCNFGKFINFGLSTVRSERVNIIYSSFISARETNVMNVLSTYSQTLALRRICSVMLEIKGSEVAESASGASANRCLGFNSVRLHKGYSTCIKYSSRRQSAHGSHTSVGRTSFEMSQHLIKIIFS